MRICISVFHALVEPTESRSQELRRKRNKSGLSASDRRMLHGEPPQIGLQYPMAAYHFTQPFRYDAGE